MCRLSSVSQCEHGAVRLEGDEVGRSISQVWLALNKAEAARLREVLDDMLGDDADSDPEWHAHVAADDGTAEITVGWDRSGPH